MSSVDSIPFKRCSHISMGVLILLIIDIVMSILSNWCASLQVDPIISTFVRSILSFLNGIHSIFPKLPLFSRPPTLFLQGLRFLNQVSILLMGSFSILFRQCSYPVILRKILTELQVYHSSSLFFSGGLISSFGVDHIYSFCFTYLPM